MVCKLFFLAPTAFDEQVASKKWNADAVKVLSAFRDEIKILPNLSANSAKETLENVTAKLGIKTGQILQALRMSLTGGASGPDLMMTMEIIGADEVVGRITFALENLKGKAT